MFNIFPYVFQTTFNTLMNSDFIDNIIDSVLNNETVNNMINEIENMVSLDINLSEREKEYIISGRLPGVRKSDIDVDYNKFQVLVPMYKGLNGIDILNKDLQEVFNPYSDSKEEISVGDTIFRVNDKVIQLINMPDDNVFNGDIGYIKEINKSNVSASKKNEIIVN